VLSWPFDPINWIRFQQGILRGKDHCTVDLLFDRFVISCMTIGNFCFYLQNRLIQTSQTGGQWYSDTSPFSIPWISAARSSQQKCVREKGKESDANSALIGPVLANKHRPQWQYTFVGVLK
jgi:hypothetical protein